MLCGAIMSNWKSFLKQEVDSASVRKLVTQHGATLLKKYNDQPRGRFVVAAASFASSKGITLTDTCLRRNGKTGTSASTPQRGGGGAGANDSKPAPRSFGHALAFALFAVTGQRVVDGRIAS